jgi:hypothetical protein
MDRRSVAMIRASLIWLEAGAAVGAMILAPERRFTRMAGGYLLPGLVVGAALPWWRPGFGRWGLVWAHALLVGFIMSMASGVSYHVLPRAWMPSPRRQRQPLVMWQRPAAPRARSARNSPRRPLRYFG